MARGHVEGKVKTNVRIAPLAEADIERAQEQIRALQNQLVEACVAYLGGT